MNKITKYFNLNHLFMYYIDYGEITLKLIFNDNCPIKKVLCKFSKVNKMHEFLSLLQETIRTKQMLVIRVESNKAIENNNVAEIEMYSSINGSLKKEIIDFEIIEIQE